MTSGLGSATASPHFIRSVTCLQFKSLLSPSQILSYLSHLVVLDPLQRAQPHKNTYSHVIFPSLLSDALSSPWAKGAADA